MDDQKVSTFRRIFWPSLSARVARRPIDISLLRWLIHLSGECSRTSRRWRDYGRAHGGGRDADRGRHHAGELGLELKGVDTVLNVDEGFKLLRNEFDIGEDETNNLTGS